jgi:hypothetical protein
MGQAKARGTKEQRVAEALSQPPKPRKMSNREVRVLAYTTAVQFVRDKFKQMDDQLG